MRTLLRFVKTPGDRTAARKLRASIRSHNIEHYGHDPDGDEDPRMDGRTLAAFANRDLVGTIDVHWGGDHGIDKSKIELHEVFEHTRNAPLINIVMLDEPMIHPAWRDEPIAMELKEAAARFALRQKARYVFSASQPSHVAVHQALGFRTTAGPGHNRINSNLVPMVLDLGDTENLRRVQSPLYEPATKVVAEGGFADGPTRQDTEEAERSEDELDQDAIWRQIFSLQRQARRSGAAFLSDIERSEIAGLMLGSHVLQPRKGERIIQQNDRGRELFLVLTGEVAVKRAGRVLAILGPGDVVGEIGFLLETRRTSDVLAETSDVRVLRMSASHLDEIMARDAKLAARISIGIAKALCRKLM